MSQNFAPKNFLGSKWSQNSISKIFFDFFPISLGAKQICATDFVVHLVSRFRRHAKMCVRMTALFNKWYILFTKKNNVNTLRLVKNKKETTYYFIILILLYQELKWNDVWFILANNAVFRVIERAQTCKQSPSRATSRGAEGHDRHTIQWQDKWAFWIKLALPIYIKLKYEPRLAWYKHLELKWCKPPAVKVTSSLQTLYIKSPVAYNGRGWTCRGG